MKGEIVFDECYMCNIAIFSSFICKMSYAIGLKHDRNHSVWPPLMQNYLFKLGSSMPT